MSHSWVIRAEQVGKRYVLSHEKDALVRGLLPHLFRRRYVSEFFALRDVSLAIPQGQCVGVIGPNGAGKSTLLAVLAGITAPSTGCVETQGRLVPFLALGTGFHPELTGEQNVWLSGALLGMSTAEIRRHFNAIAVFAGLDGFLDAPLATYSAGMQMRLGFAVAIHAEADVFLIDEAMAVGDQAFQAKCLERLAALRRAGKTLIIVTHDLGTLRGLADRALLLQGGRVIADGTVAHVQERYAGLLPWLASPQEPLSRMAREAVEDQVKRHESSAIMGGWGERWGSDMAEIESVTLHDGADQPVAAVPSGSPITIAVHFRAVTPLPDPHVGIAMFRDDATYCYGPNTRMEGLQWEQLEPGRYACRLRVDALSLTPGRYRLSVAIWDTNELAPYAYDQAVHPLTITGNSSPGVVVFPHVWRRRSPIPSAVSRDALLVEGPRGAQTWYRTFEPLTLTAFLPAPPRTPAALVAECLGSNKALWWASRWVVPADGGTPEACPQDGYTLHIPQLMLLTGRYQWRIGWDQAETGRSNEEAVERTIEVVADRRDHGLIYLSHRWEVHPCQTPHDATLMLP